MAYNSDETQALKKEIIRELPNAEHWLTCPNMWLAGDTPEQRIQTGDLESVRQLVYRILYIGVT